MRVWRLVKSKYAASAFDGEGARLYGARWSSVGTSVAYASSDAALAVLEVLVHLERAAILSSYSLIRAVIPDRSIEELDASALPESWRDSPPTFETQRIGDEWVREGRSLALRVPSTIVPGASNFLINPAHRDFARFRVESVERLDLDPRLVR